MLLIFQKHRVAAGEPVPCFGDLRGIDPLAIDRRRRGPCGDRLPQGRLGRVHVFREMDGREVERFTQLFVAVAEIIRGKLSPDGELRQREKIAECRLVFLRRQSAVEGAAGGGNPLRFRRH